MNVSAEKAPNQEYLEMTLVEVTATGKGKNDFIRMENLHDGTYKRTSGRIGIRVGPNKPFSRRYPMEEWERDYGKSIALGYQIIKTEKMDKVEIHKSGFKEISEPEVREIIHRLLRYADEAMQASYSVKVDAISDEMIRKGQEILDEMTDLYDRIRTIPDWEKEDYLPVFNKRLMQLYQTIPRRQDHLSTQILRGFESVPDRLQEEYDLYNMMVAQVKNLVPCNQETILEKNGLEMELVTDEKEKNWIIKRMGSEGHNFRKAWRVTNRKTQKGFDDFCKKYKVGKDGITYGFHGSASRNFWSILSNGLSVDAPVAHGSAFGRGGYLAVDAVKSKGYTSCQGSRWEHGAENTGFMGLFRIATGTRDQQLEPQFCSGSLNWKSIQQQGKLCTWYHTAEQKERGIGFVMDEIVVYQESQVDIRYFIELAV